MGVYAYGFSGYWKDVGTVTSLWEANMDLLGDEPLINLNDPNFKIYSRNCPLPPSYIGSDGKFKNSLMTTGCEINGSVIDSVLGEGVVVEEGALVKSSVVMRGTRICKGARLNYAMVDENCVIGKNCVLGDENSNKNKIALVGGGVTLKDGTKLKAGEIVERED